MYKKTQYTLVMVLLFVFIALSVGLPQLLTPYSAGDISVPEPIIPNEKDDENTFDVDVPSANSDPYKKIDYALKVLREGKGYKGTVSQIFKTVGHEQHMYHKRYKGGGIDYLESWFKMYGMMASMGKNEFVGSFYDGQNVHVKTINNNTKQSFEDKAYTSSYADKKEEFTMKQWTEEKKEFPLNYIMLNVNKKNSTVLKQDKISESKYYVIVVKLDIGRLDKEYVDVFKQNGGEGVVIHSVMLTLKINKKTGYLYSYNKIDKFRASYAGMSGECEINSTDFYYDINQSALPQIQQLALENFGKAM